MIDTQKILSIIYEDPRCDRRDDYYQSLALYASWVPEGGTILEIGTLYGASALAMLCGSHPSVTVVCVDPIFATGSITYPDAHRVKGYAFHSSLKDFAEKLTKHGFNSRVNVFSDYSWNILERWDRKRKLDAILIDGEHTSEAILKDCKWMDLVKPGGWVAFDDYFDVIELAIKQSIANKSEWSIVHESTTAPRNGMCVTLLKKS